MFQFRQFNSIGIVTTTIFQILMYEAVPGRLLHRVTTEPGRIPDQAVIFEKRSEDDAMYVVKVSNGTCTQLGIYETNKPCAEYLNTPLGERRCVPTFKFLVLKYGEYASVLVIKFGDTCQIWMWLKQSHIRIPHPHPLFCGGHYCAYNLCICNDTRPVI